MVCMEILYADRQPCPVCGHPTGDCVGDSPPPTHIVGAGLFPSLPYEEMIKVEEDVYEEIPASEFTTVRVLVAKAGTYVPRSTAIRLGIIS